MVSGCGRASHRGYTQQHTQPPTPSDCAVNVPIDLCMLALAPEPELEPLLALEEEGDVGLLTGGPLRPLTTVKVSCVW